MTLSVSGFGAGMACTKYQSATLYVGGLDGYEIKKSVRQAASQAGKQSATE